MEPDEDFEDVVKEEIPECTIVVPGGRVTAMLVYLAEVYHVSLGDMFYLHGLMGQDIFKLFYVFAGKQLAIPGIAKQYRMYAFAAKYRSYIDGELQPTTEQEIRVVEAMRCAWNAETEKFEVKLEEPDGKKRKNKVSDTESGIPSEADPQP